MTPGSTTQSTILGVDGEHAVHVAEIERNAAARRVDLAFERCAGAERDHRHALGRTSAHDLLHLLGGLRKDHGVRGAVEWWVCGISPRAR